jgi:two-component system OmpR family response regulator
MLPDGSCEDCVNNWRNRDCGRMIAGSRLDVGRCGMRLLVVEDETNLAAAMRRGLVHEGFAVDLAATGTAALALAEDTDYDVILLDLMLPGLSGYEVARRLRARGDWTPLLVVSAKDGEYDQADALDLGADDFLAKPFSFVVLLARLRALVRRGRSPRPSVLHAGALAVDPAARTVELDGKEVELTRREFRLLEYLIGLAGQTVSKTELLEHVWDAGPDADPNQVQVYVGYLRRKLGPEVILTVRGAGYRIDA